MKLGLGLYRHMLNDDYYSFAVQAGCTHVIVHLVDYFRQGEANPAQNQPTGEKDKPWGVAGDPNRLWTVEELIALRKQVEAAGLKLEAIENLDPAHWYDVLLDGPLRAKHIENVKTILRAMGEAGIGTLGYNFSIAGVCGRKIKRPVRDLCKSPLLRFRHPERRRADNSCIPEGFPSRSRRTCSDEAPCESGVTKFLIKRSTSRSYEMGECAARGKSRSIKFGIFFKNSEVLRLRLG